MAIHPARRLFTVDEYHRMAEAGIFGEDDRLELIDGEVSEMTPIGRRHVACVIRLNKFFGQMVGERALVSAQNPVQLLELSEPQPDLALLRPRADFYASRLPKPDDIILLVEVAESSADYDHKVKATLYARHGVQEMWLVDLEQETVTIYLNPTADGYHTSRVLRRGDEIAHSAFGDRAITVSDILG